MGKIELPRHTQHALREPTPWGLYAKRAGFSLLLVLALFIAYKEATRPPAPVKTFRIARPQPQVIVIREPAPQPPPAPTTAPTSETPSESAPPEPPAEETHAAVYQAVAKPPAPAPIPPPEAEPPPKPKTLRERMDECIEITGERDNSVMSPGGVQVKVYARNMCGEDFPGNERWFKIFAVSPNGSYLGTETGRFQTTIKGHDSGETAIFVPCDPNSVSRFEFKPWP